MKDGMRGHGRRQLLAMAGLGLLTGCERSGEQPSKVRRIGFLAVGSREGRAFLIEGFLRGLREHGYVEGQNIVIEYRFSEARNDRLPELAAELVAMKVELIVASGSLASFAAGKATRTIPIVMGSLAANPVETGLVASLARPGGNITGMTEMASQLSGKRLELLKATVPGLSRVAVFWNPPNPAYGPVLRELEAAAQTLGVALQRLEVRAPEDFAGALEAAVRQRAGALFVPGDPLVTNRPRVIADLALKHRLPTMTDFQGASGIGRSALFRAGPRRFVPTSCDPCGQDSEGGQRRRSADGAAHEVRPVRQPEDRSGSRLDHSAVGHGAGHSRDPVGDRSGRDDGSSHPVLDGRGVG